MKYKIQFFFLNNHLLAEQNFFKISAKYKVFSFLLFITYPNFTKFVDKKVLPRLMGYGPQFCSVGFQGLLWTTILFSGIPVSIMDHCSVQWDSRVYCRAGNSLICSSLIRSFAHSLIRSFCSNRMSDCEGFAQIAQDK